MRKDLKGDNAPTNYVEWAIDQADNQRNIGPLKQAFPDLARFLKLPKRKRGERGPSRRYDPVMGAAKDVRRIRALWQQHYRRKKRTSAPYAEEIAADRWAVSVAAVASKIKNLKK